MEPKPRLPLAGICRLLESPVASAGINLADRIGQLSSGLLASRATTGVSEETPWFQNPRRRLVSGRLPARKEGAHPLAKCRSGAEWRCCAGTVGCLRGRDRLAARLVAGRGHPAIHTPQLAAYASVFFPQ